MYIDSHVKHFCNILKKSEISRQTFEKSVKWEASCSVRMDGQANRTKLVASCVILRKSLKADKILCNKM